MSRALSRAPIAAAAGCAAGFGAVMFLVYGTLRAADLDARLLASAGSPPRAGPLLDVIAHSADLAPLLAFLVVLTILPCARAARPT